MQFHNRIQQFNEDYGMFHKAPSSFTHMYSHSLWPTGVYILTEKSGTTGGSQRMHMELS